MTISTRRVKRNDKCGYTGRDHARRQALVEECGWRGGGTDSLVKTRPSAQKGGGAMAPTMSQLGRCQFVAKLLDRKSGVSQTKQTYVLIEKCDNTYL